MQPDSPAGLALLLLAGLVAGAINAVAGGGSLITLPTLIGMGMPEVRAAATNTVGLCAGSLSSAIGFLPALRQNARLLAWMMPVTVLGAAFGAWLLSQTTPERFRLVIPVLLLMATVVLAFDTGALSHQGRRAAWMIGPLLFGIGIYGGYAGAGIGVMILATLRLGSSGDLNALNAMKNWIALAANLSGAIVLALYGLVEWVPALAVLIGAMVGGYASARTALRLDPSKLRPWIVAYGLVMTIWFVYRFWL